MTLSTELPIYADTYELAKVVIKEMELLPKLYKPTLGKRITDTVLDMFEEITLANKSINKPQTRIYHIDLFLVCYERLVISLRLCKDLKLIAERKYQYIFRLLSPIGKQANGWKNSIK